MSIMNMMSVDEPNKIMSVKVGDFVRCIDNIWDAKFGKHLYIGDVVVVKEIYKHFIRVAKSPGESEFMISERQFDLIEKDYNLIEPYYGDSIDIDYNSIGPCYGINRDEDPIDINKNEEESSMSMANELNKMFGAIAPGMCRLSMSGNIAVKTSNGYKSYNMKTGRLVNCDNFALDPGTEWFFCIPTNHVKTGDIILINNKPCCVKNVDNDNDQITVINYENNTVDTVLPERHMFMGSMYFYSKVVSPFNTSSKKGGGMKKMMKYAMMSEMMKGSNFQSTSGSSNTSAGFGGMFGGNPMAMMMLMGGGTFGDLFDGMFDDDDEGFGFMSGMFDDDDEEETTVVAKKKTSGKKTTKTAKENQDEEAE